MSGRFAGRAGRTSVVLLVLVLLAVAAGWVWTWMKPVPAPAGAGAPVVIGASRTASLLWLADSLGYFADAGLEVAVRRYPSGKAAADGLIGGEVNVATSAEFVLVKQSFRHPELRVLASLQELDTIKLVARRSIDSVSELKGRRIGVANGTAAQFFLDRFLLLHGLTKNQVQEVHLPTRDMYDAMADGRVDAAFTWEPIASRIARGPAAGGVLLPGQGGQSYYFLLLAKEAWIDAHPGAVTALLSALLRAERYAAENTERAQALIERRFELQPGSLAPLWIAHRNHVVLPQPLLTVMGDQARWALERGIVEGVPPNFLRMLHLDGLESVRPRAVTVAR